MVTNDAKIISCHNLFFLNAVLINELKLREFQAKKSYQMGDSETARSQADQARQLSNISIAVGGVSFVVLFIFIIIYYVVIISSLSD